MFKDVTEQIHGKAVGELKEKMCVNYVEEIAKSIKESNQCKQNYQCEKLGFRMSRGVFLLCYFIP